MRRSKRRTKKIRRKMGGASAGAGAEDYLKKMALKHFPSLDYTIGMGPCKVLSQEDFESIFSKEGTLKFLLTCHGMNPDGEPFQLKHLKILRFGCGPQNKNAGVHCVFDLEYMTDIMRHIKEYEACLKSTELERTRSLKRSKTIQSNQDNEDKHFENYLLTNWDDVERDTTAGLYLYDDSTGELIPVLLFCPHENHVLDLKLFALFIEKNFCIYGKECELVTLFCRDYRGPNKERRERSRCAPNFNIAKFKKNVDKRTKGKGSP